MTKHIRHNINPKTANETVETFANARKKQIKETKKIYKPMVKKKKSSKRTYNVTKKTMKACRRQEEAQAETEEKTKRQRRKQV